MATMDFTTKPLTPGEISLVEWRSGVAPDVDANREPSQGQNQRTLKRAPLNP